MCRCRTRRVTDTKTRLIRGVSVLPNLFSEEEKKTPYVSQIITKINLYHVCIFSISTTKIQILMYIFQSQQEKYKQQ